MRVDKTELLTTRHRCLLLTSIDICVCASVVCVRES
jgi:hypothetical protein